MAVEVFAHARRGDGVFLSEHQKRRGSDMGEQGAGIGLIDGIQRRLQGGRCAVAGEVGQDFV